MDLLEEYIYLNCNSYEDFYNIYMRVYFYISIRKLPKDMYLYNNYMFEIVYCLYYIQNITPDIIRHILYIFLYDLFHYESPNIWVFIVKIDNNMLRKLFVELLLDYGSEYKDTINYERLCMQADYFYEGWDIIN